MTLFRLNGEISLQHSSYSSSLLTGNCLAQPQSSSVVKEHFVGLWSQSGKCWGLVIHFPSAVHGLRTSSPLVTSLTCKHLPPDLLRGKVVLWCVLPVSYNNTSEQWAVAFDVEAALRDEYWRRLRSLGWMLLWIWCCIFRFLSSVTAGEVSSLRKLWSWKFAEPFCLFDFGVNSVLNCLKTNLICVKAGAYASGYRIPHLSILCCCFGLYNAPYINSTVGFVHIFVLLLIWTW